RAPRARPRRTKPPPGSPAEPFRDAVPPSDPGMRDAAADRRCRSVRELDELARVVIERRAEIEALRRERDLARSRTAALRRQPAARVAIGMVRGGRRLVAKI